MSSSNSMRSVGSFVNAFLTPSLSIFGVLFFVFTVNIFAEEVSFFVPEDHEKFPKIDSLYTLLEEKRAAVIAAEPTIIPDESVRNDEMEIKKRYFNHLLKTKSCDSSKVLNFCKDLESLYETKMNYFNTLLSALEGDVRAKCFIFWRSAREEYAQIRDYLSQLEISAEPVATIEYDATVKEKTSLEIKEPSLSDILGDDVMGDEDEETNPFATESGD